MEEMGTIFDEGEQKKKEGDHGVFFTRHSQAQYRTYQKIKLSDNPQAAVDYENQITPDLSEPGIALARERAGEFFARFDPEHDALFFASSNEARAIETADVYRRVAKEKGFEVIKPEHTRSTYADELGEGEIRVLQNLSLNIENTILAGVFNPDSQQNPKFTEKLDSETQEKYTKARAIINQHDYGNFGENFFHYSKEIQNIFPEIESSNDLFESQFQHLLRLAQFGINKSNTSGISKHIKILAFGHENYMSYALNKYFGDHEIKNCETIDIAITPEDTFLTRRGDRVSISNE